MKKAIILAAVYGKRLRPLTKKCPKPLLKIGDQTGANAYDLLKYKNVIFTTSSIKSFQERVIK